MEQMQQCEVAPYGAWKSPLIAALVSSASKRLGGAAIGSDGRLIWLEGRPSEAGLVSFPSLCTVHINTCLMDLSSTCPVELKVTTRMQYAYAKHCLIFTAWCIAINFISKQHHHVLQDS